MSPRRRVISITGVMNASTQDQQSLKEEQASLNALWKQVMDPVLDYCQVRRFTPPLSSSDLTVPPYCRRSYKTPLNPPRQSFRS